MNISHSSNRPSGLSEQGRERWGMGGWEGVGTGVGTKNKKYIEK